jgi:hypothetical protein
MVFAIFDCILRRKFFNNSFSAWFKKSLIKFEILPENLFRKLVRAFRKLPNLKVVSKAACDSENFSESRQ